MSDHRQFSDWVPAPNIRKNPELYELENDAIARDGRLDQRLLNVCDWTSKTLLDVGTGTGYWLPHYAEKARQVVGIEPDSALLACARQRIAALDHVEAVAGSAEEIPLADESVDVAHARFSYFFGEGGDDGLAEVARVLKPGGSLVVVDNSWETGDFARLLQLATGGNASIDPDGARAWWEARGASRTDVASSWICKTPLELEQLLRMEFAEDVVDRFWAKEHDGTKSLSYTYAIYHWQKRCS